MDRVWISCLQFAICKAFLQFEMKFLHFCKNCESLKLDSSWMFIEFHWVTHWSSCLVSYFKALKCPLLNDNIISQRFIVHINFKLHTSFHSNYHSVAIYQYWLYFPSVNFYLYSPFFKFSHCLLSFNHDFENTSEINYLKTILHGRIFILFSQFTFSVLTRFQWAYNEGKLFLY